MHGYWFYTFYFVILLLSIPDDYSSTREYRRLLYKEEKVFPVEETLRKGLRGFGTKRKQ